MRHRWFTSLGAAVLAVSLAMVAVSAQAPSGGAYKTPANTFGQPDLEGVWANNSATPLERPKQLEGRKFLTETEVARLKSRAAELFNGDGDAAFGEEIFVAALSGRDKYVADSFDKDTGNYNSFWLVDRDFDNRTSLITEPEDGRVPEMTPAAKARLGDTSLSILVVPQKADSHQDRPLYERCITFGFPDLLAGYNSYYQISQAKDYVAISTERIHDTRVIPLDGRPHPPKNVTFLHGDSRGRYEGATLVVVTKNFSGKSPFMGSAENLEITERFKRMGAKTISYEVTVTDPTTWTKSWKFMVPLKHSNEKIYEYACHEGNTGMIGVLAGARVQEREKSGK